MGLLISRNAASSAVHRSAAVTTFHLFQSADRLMLGARGIRIHTHTCAYASKHPHVPTYTYIYSRTRVINAAAVHEVGREPASAFPSRWAPLVPGKLGARAPFAADKPKSHYSSLVRTREPLNSCPPRPEESALARSSSIVPTLRVLAPLRRGIMSAAGFYSLDPRAHDFK